jgi:hypothetical protein
MGTLVEDAVEMAEWISAALRSSGYAADFRPASLRELDRFFDENTRHGRPIRRGLLSKDLGKRVFAIGAYVGEVIRRDLGGQWHGDDSDPHGETNMELRLPGGRVIWPMQRCMKRLVNGPEDGLAAYGVGLGLSLEASRTQE